MPPDHGLVHYVALPRAGRGDSDACMTVLGPFCWSFPRRKQKKRRFISIHIMHHAFCRLESFQCTYSVPASRRFPPQKSQQKFSLPFTKRGTYQIKKAYTVIHNKIQSSSNFQVRRERSCQLSSLRSPQLPTPSAMFAPRSLRRSTSAPGRSPSPSPERPERSDGLGRSSPGRRRKDTEAKSAVPQDRYGNGGWDVSMGGFGC